MREILNLELKAIRDMHQARRHEVRRDRYPVVHSVSYVSS